MLNRINIRGYKSIRELDLKLKPINILIGANGVGKTNFISFFRLVNNIYEQRLQSFTMQNSADKLLHNGFKRTQKIVGKLSFSNNAYSFVLMPRDNGSMYLAREESWYLDSANTMLNLDESYIKSSTSYRDKWLRDYIESYRIYHFHDTGKGAPLRSASRVHDNNILKTDGANLPSYLFYLQQKYPKTLKRIELTIQSVMPYFERFELAPSVLDESSIRLEWKEYDNPDKYFDANDLSDGSIRFIALATLLLQPNLPKVIVIDEPELGLHPVAINKLAAMMQSVAARGCQMIVSTQSVNLINNFAAEDIVTVDRKDGQSVFNRLNSEDLYAWLDDYTLGDLWTKSVIAGQPTLL